MTYVGYPCFCSAEGRQPVFYSGPHSSLTTTGERDIVGLPTRYRTAYRLSITCFHVALKNVRTNELAQVRTKGDIFLRKRQALDLIRGSKEKGLSTKYCCQPLLVATLDPLNLLFVRQKIVR